MPRACDSFRLLEAVEISLALGGATLAAAGGLQGEDSLRGVGLGLAVQGAAMLLLDLPAARRARRYTGSLLRF